MPSEDPLGDARKYVVGLLFAFALVAMPGLTSLDYGSSISAFQVIDRVIQDNHPLFLLVWVGSFLATIAAPWASETNGS